MKAGKVISIWNLIISALVIILGFAFLYTKMDIIFWIPATSLGLLTISYYFSSIYYYIKNNNKDFIYLLFVGSIIFAGIVGLYFYPDSIVLYDYEVVAKFQDYVVYSIFMMIFGVIGIAFSFAPHLNFGKNFKDFRAEILIYISIILTILPLFLIVLFVVRNGLFYEGNLNISIEFLTQPIKEGGSQGGVLPAILGTLSLLGLVTLFTLPMGVGTAIYLSEYSKRGPFTRVVRTAVNILQGTPSVVHGLFGYAVFVLILFGPSLLAASLTLSILTLPIVISSSEEALKDVPNEMRDASLALGGTNWQTIKKVVLPTALPRIITGTVLGLGRAAGETAPILFTGAIFFGADVVPGVFSRFQALPYHLWILFTRFGFVGKDFEPNAWATAFLLLIIVLSINVVAIIMREKLRKEF